MRKVSISKKINYLIIFSTVILSLLMIGINIVVSNTYANYTASNILNLACVAQKNKLNDQFRIVENSVKNIYDLSEEFRPSYEELCEIDTSELFIQQFKKMAYAITENTDGAVAVYYRMNPELSGNGSQGFFYVKDAKTGAFSENEITDILKFDPSDVEHVGWFYIPARAGKSMWMDPYYNANIDVNMISYVVPIFDDKRFVGVVGMDVDFDRLVELAEDVNIYKNGGASLASLTDGNIYYKKKNVFGDKVSDDFFFILANSENFEQTMTYKSAGEAYQYYFDELYNGMKILVYANKSEINAQRNIFILIGSGVLVVGLLTALLVALRISKRITGPIIEITEATKKYAVGEWETTVTCDTNDELKDLTDNLTVMATKTKEYFDYINELARHDGLTGLRNKTSYFQNVEKMNSEFVAEKKEFAVVVCDLNNLKYINDNYGHEKGDQLLKNAGAYICNKFVHSPVFRIGGDEFVAILYSEDYKIRRHLIDDMHKHMFKQKNRDDVSDVCIASGIAEFPAEGDTYDEIFELADKRMYENKLALKGGKDTR